jgi:cell division protein FtsW
MTEHRTIDPWLLGALLILLGIGITMVLNTSYLFAQERFGDGTYLFRRQLFALAVGGVGCACTLAIRPSSYRYLAYPLLALTFLALVLVLIPGIGVVRGGARRWLYVGPLTFQPAELAKLSFVLYLSHSLSKKIGKVQDFAYGLMPHLLVAGVLLALMLAEPDFGSTLILATMTVAMLFVAGGKVSHLLCIGVAGLPAVGFFLLHADYRVKRLLTFLDPWSDAANSGFQIIQSYIAFGSGQIWGRGLGQSRQKLLYLPEAHTDFIYSVIGEELGLWGALVVLGLFGIILFRGLWLALKTEDPFLQLLTFGLTTLLGLQALIHMSVVMGLVPTKGLVLPFVSYGGSAMVVNMVLAGMLLNASWKR